MTDIVHDVNAIQNLSQLTEREREIYQLGAADAVNGTELSDPRPAEPEVPRIEKHWSAQQSAIFAWFAKDKAGLDAALMLLGLDLVIDVDGNLIVRARAGTGKTTTIIEGINRAPESRILLAAFNKRIATELSERITNTNAEAKTLHALGYACVRRWWERINVDTRGNRVKTLVQTVCGDQTPDAIKRLVGKLMTHGREITPHAKELGDLTELAIEFDCQPDEEWEAAGFDLEYVEARALQAMELASKTRPRDGIDYADMIFLPVRNHWMTPIYDLVVVDEAQDMTVAQLELARGVCKGRFCVVGDDRQAIYKFRGADAGSLDRLKTELKAGELGLTKTYRCGKTIVGEAQKLVSDFEAGENNPAGSVSSMTAYDADGLAAVADKENFILSRTNAPLARVAMALLRARKRVRIQGKDIGAGLKALVKKLMTGRAAHSIPEFLTKLGRWEEREAYRAVKAGHEDKVEFIRDKAETLRVIAEGITGPRELEARLDSLFSDDANHGSIVCSTVHKAKGLEADRVYVLRDTLYPMPPKGKTVSTARMQEEVNIHYVAVTRAKDALIYVHGIK